MKVIIVGYGRLGRGLAHTLEQKGDTVTVIDSRPEAFGIFGDTFQGKAIVGVGFDKDVLEQAGIAMTDAIVACTEHDETNALIARVARHRYRVPHAVARLYDPRKASVYHALGVQTISTTSWGVRYATELLSYSQLDSVMDIGDGRVQILRVEVSALLEGRPVDYLNRPGESQVVAMRRGNKSVVPTNGTVMAAGDILFVSAVDTALPVLKEMLGL